MKRIQVVNGPNLNLLGTREPEVYGRVTLAEIEQQLQARAAQLDAQIDFMQSNHEGVLIDAIQAARASAAGMIINPAAFGHTSYALRDAIVATALPSIEVHISNVFARDAHRRNLVLSDVCRGVITGLGWRGYLLALDALLLEGGA